MRRRPNLAFSVERRISYIRRSIRIDTQSLRDKWIFQLNGVFNTAASIATGQIRQHQVGDKIQFITPKERQMWAHVSAHVAEVMGNLSKGYDERQFNEDIVEMERQIGEIKKLQTQIDQQRNQGTGQNTAEETDEPADFNI